MSGLSPLIYSAYSICKSHKLHFLLLPSLFLLLFSLFCPHTCTQNSKKKRKKKPAAVRIKYSSKHWQSQWAIKCQPQPVHKQRDCSSVKQWLWSSWRKITWYKKNKTKQKKKARRQSCCYNLSQNHILFNLLLLSHTNCSPLQEE